MPKKTDASHEIWTAKKGLKDNTVVLRKISSSEDASLSDVDIDNTMTTTTTTTTVTDKSDTTNGNSNVVHTSKKKKTTMSIKSGLLFSVSRSRNILRGRNPELRIAVNAAVFSTAVIEYLITEVIEASVRIMQSLKKSTLMNKHVRAAFEMDLELKGLLKPGTSISHQRIVLPSVVPPMPNVKNPETTKTKARATVTKKSQVPNKKNKNKLDQQTQPKQKSRKETAVPVVTSNSKKSKSIKKK